MAKNQRKRTTTTAAAAAAAAATTTKELNAHQRFNLKNLFNKVSQKTNTGSSQLFLSIKYATQTKLMKENS
jgi:cobalamin biosynthesis protein CbiD